MNKRADYIYHDMPRARKTASLQVDCYMQHFKRKKMTDNFTKKLKTAHYGLYSLKLQLKIANNQAN